jgi:hypothetical protein
MTVADAVWDVRKLREDRRERGMNAVKLWRFSIRIIDGGKFMT